MTSEGSEIGARAQSLTELDEREYQCLDRQSDAARTAQFGLDAAANGRQQAPSSGAIRREVEGLHHIDEAGT